MEKKKKLQCGDIHSENIEDISARGESTYENNRKESAQDWWNATLYPDSPHVSER